MADILEKHAGVIEILKIVYNLVRRIMLPSKNLHINNFIIAASKLIHSHCIQNQYFI